MFAPVEKRQLNKIVRQIREIETPDEKVLRKKRESDNEAEATPPHEEANNEASASDTSEANSQTIVADSSGAESQTVAADSSEAGNQTIVADLLEANSTANVSALQEPTSAAENDGTISAGIGDVSSDNSNVDATSSTERIEEAEMPDEGPPPHSTTKQKTIRPSAEHPHHVDELMSEETNDGSIANINKLIPALLLMLYALL